MSNYETLEINSFNGIKKRDTRKEGRRSVRCISFERNIITGKIYAHWQYFLAKTGKAQGRNCTSFLELIPGQ